MPNNHKWIKYKPFFFYKEQDYEFSCFSACLQMVLANFGFIKAKKEERITEEEFNNYMIGMDLPNLDEEAPSLDFIDNFLLGNLFTGGNYLSRHMVGKIDVAAFERIIGEIRIRGNIAIIGSIIPGAGHALAIIKCKGQCYGVNPHGGEGSLQVIDENNIELRADGRGNYAIYIPDIGAINHCWMIYP